MPQIAGFSIKLPQTSVCLNCHILILTQLISIVSRSVCLHAHPSVHPSIHPSTRSWPADILVVAGINPKDIFADSPDRG